jgi:diadenosine tetraphosphate (Ap4A) HIT family hydrolase
MQENLPRKVVQDCLHCNPASFAFETLLETTANFFTVCDANPIVEGHVLIIPKAHISCVGGYSSELFKEFAELNEKVSHFLNTQHGVCSSFEHGKLGQTVFHSHVHYLPFRGNAADIVPEGMQTLTKLLRIEDVQDIFRERGGYLYFSIGEEKWVVAPALAAPGFFRDRFARALGKPERGDWKKVRADAELRAMSEKYNTATQERWRKFVV